MYKLIGPALIRQDLPEVRANVEKRLDFINSELYYFLTKQECLNCSRKKVEYLLKDSEQKQIASRTKVNHKNYFFKYSFFKMNKIRENFQKLLQEKQQQGAK